MINLKLAMQTSKGEPATQNFKTAEIVNGKVKEKSERREILLEDLFKASLLNNVDRDISPAEVSARYQLFKKIRGKEKIDLNQEEKDLIIKLVCEKYEILFAGQVIEALN